MKRRRKLTFLFRLKRGRRTDSSNYRVASQITIEPLLIMYCFSNHGYDHNMTGQRSLTLSNKFQPLISYTFFFSKQKSRCCMSIGAHLYVHSNLKC